MGLGPTSSARVLKLPRGIFTTDCSNQVVSWRPYGHQLRRAWSVPAPVMVIMPATHDTASAVAGQFRQDQATTLRASPPDWCYLSSGTWSLLGVEVPHPVINAETMKYNFTNEGGVAGTTRLLKNIMGLWLVQECRRTWARTGHELSYEEIIARAQVAPAFTALVDPDDSSFLAPGDMPAG